MPRPALPPTPASSTDIKGEDGPHFGQMSFELPPPAIGPGDSRPSSASTKSSSASSYHPTSPKSPAISPTNVNGTARRRSSAAPATSRDAFTLPPPPTRSRKIIQMKPRGQPEQPPDMEVDAGKATSAKAAASATSKKKQPSATSVAGRKIARKTAHSLIERRRRSKMNEEFEVLKSMIPACTGDMHKLAILQASIDYVRYLEDCVAKLKVQNSRRTPTPTTTQAYTPLPPTAPKPYNRTENYGVYDVDEDEDMEMTGSEAPSPNYVMAPSQSHQPSISPALLAQDPQQHQASYSSNSNDSRHYSYSTSSTTSPAFGPRPSEYAISNSAGNSTLPSPALLPQGDLDHEATAALLMLNTDRRGTHGRGMSVKDLLSA